MFEEILDVPESEAFLKVSALLDEVNASKAACEQKEAELQSLREETAELVAAKLAEAGADEAFVQAAKAMWLKDPQSTSQAIAGGSIKETIAGDFVQSARGCNQYKHKPGCPEEDEKGDTDSTTFDSKNTPIKREIADKGQLQEDYKIKKEKDKFDSNLSWFLSADYDINLNLKIINEEGMYRMSHSILEKEDEIYKNVEIMKKELLFILPDIKAKTSKFKDRINAVRQSIKKDNNVDYGYLKNKNNELKILQNAFVAEQLKSQKLRDKLLKNNKENYYL